MREPLPAHIADLWRSLWRNFLARDGQSRYDRCFRAFTEGYELGTTENVFINQENVTLRGENEQLRRAYRQGGERLTELNNRNSAQATTIVALQSEVDRLNRDRGRGITINLTVEDGGEVRIGQ